MGKHINPFDLVTTSDAYIRASKRAQMFTDEYITPFVDDAQAQVLQTELDAVNNQSNVCKKLVNPQWKNWIDYNRASNHRFLTFKTRKMTEGPHWDIATRPERNGMQLNPVSVLARNSKGEYLFIIQPRPALKGKQMVVSLPAGLREPNATIASLNEKIKQKAQRSGIQPDLVPERFQIDPAYNDPVMLTALLELKEETGFYPQQCRIITPVGLDMPKSAGMSDEADAIVFCDVDERVEGMDMNEKAEEIDFFWLKPQEFMSFVGKVARNDRARQNVKIEYNAYLYFRGMLDGLKSNANQLIDDPKFDALLECMDDEMKKKHSRERAFNDCMEKN